VSVIVRHTRDHRGMLTSRCPRCETQFVSWDEDDLDEEGNLHCFCDEEAEDAACLAEEQRLGNLFGRNVL
jgi:anti-sigma factor RsiW